MTWMKDISASTNNLNHGNRHNSVPITNNAIKNPKKNNTDKSNRHSEDPKEERSLDQILTVEGSGPLTAAKILKFPSKVSYFAARFTMNYWSFI
jgi:hypothetical protein